MIRFQEKSISFLTIAQADPGLGIDLVGGGVDPQGSYVSKILYVKMKESEPLGTPPGSAND